MVSENTIAKNVNLLASDESLKPHDFYTFCLDLVHKKVSELTKNNPLYIRISQIQLTRDIIKRSIMTIPYNVSKIGISNQLQENFDWVKVDNQNLLTPNWMITEKPIYISLKELYILSEIIHSILFEKHPLLNDLVNYLNGMAELLSHLSLPIVWNTPSGLVIKQNYTKSKKIRVKPSLNKTSSTYTIIVPTDEIDSSKQKASLLPNLVHSLDSANICLMVDRLIKENKTHINLSTTHDCFASTADHIPSINIFVRLAFLELYSNRDYLTKLHYFYCDFITENGFILENNIVITPSDEKFVLPVPPTQGDLDLNSNLNKSLYFIN